jgi:tRNA threonylcarbamoyladenosine biosynthesis protein TsaE
MPGILSFVKKNYKKEDLGGLVKTLLKDLESSPVATVLLLDGDLGAGKTTFTQVLAEELGYSESVISPTFAIQKRYPITHGFFQNLIHIDAYRLKNSDEIEALGWSEWIKNSGNLVVVEWPSIISDVLPKGVYKISFGHIDEDTRNIEITYEK